MSTDIAGVPSGVRDHDEHERAERVIEPTGPVAFSQAQERAYLLVLMKVLRLHADADSVSDWVAMTDRSPTVELTEAGQLYIAVGQRLLAYAQQYPNPLAQDPIGADGGS
ncbi:MAG TPA: hypothetical protein VFX16_12665 [Pseudonocardiaceae bacterium]|nr:hypothetical protein [Pseudonocardiaceae bacterium]